MKRSELSVEHQELIDRLRAERTAQVAEDEQAAADEEIALSYLGKPPGYMPSEDEQQAIRRASIRALRRDGFPI